MSNDSAANAAAAWGEQIEAMGGVISSDLPDAAPIAPATSAAFFARMGQLATRMLARFATGTVAIIRQTEGETGNWNKPFQDETKPYPRNAYVSGYPSDRVDGTRIIATDLRVIFDATGLPAPPTAKDIVQIDTKKLAIVQVMAVPAAGPAALYILQARAA